MAARPSGTGKKCPDSYGAEVVKCITQMKDQQTRLTTEIGQMEAEKRRIQNEIRNLSDKLANLNCKLAQKAQFRAQVSKTIQETECAYSKLLESSQVLYKSVKDTKNQIIGPYDQNAANLDELPQTSMAPGNAVMDRRRPTMTPQNYGMDLQHEGMAVAAAVATELNSSAPYS